MPELPIKLTIENERHLGAIYASASCQGLIEEMEQFAADYGRSPGLGAAMNIVRAQGARLGAEIAGLSLRLAFDHFPEMSDDHACLTTIRDGQALVIIELEDRDDG